MSHPKTSALMATSVFADRPSPMYKQANIQSSITPADTCTNTVAPSTVTVSMGYITITRFNPATVTLTVTARSNNNNPPPGGVYVKDAFQSPSSGSTFTNSNLGANTLQGTTSTTGVPQLPPTASTSIKTGTSTMATSTPMIVTQVNCDAAGYPPGSQLKTSSGRKVFIGCGLNHRGWDDNLEEGLPNGGRQGVASYQPTYEDCARFCETRAGCVGFSWCDRRYLNETSNCYLKGNKTTGAGSPNEMIWSGMDLSEQALAALDGAVSSTETLSGSVSTTTSIVGAVLTTTPSTTGADAVTTSAGSPMVSPTIIMAAFGCPEPRETFSLLQRRRELE
ncbi:hypothetical protein OQA88_9989 [Cercophora sp. LCS_1]